MIDEKLQRNLLSYQQEQDYLKHLTTLNTGSILIVATFLEKLFEQPKWNVLVGVSLVSFIVSIIGCITTHLFSVIDVELQFTKHKTQNTNISQLKFT
jgi:hypothetical protein